MSIKATFDASAWDAGLFDKLVGPARESLARRMAVSGGSLIRDEAKVRAPVSEPPYNTHSRGSNDPGSLRESIYLAYRDGESTATTFTYSVTWARKAWWGKLIEFGWIQTHAIRYDRTGNYFWTDMERPLASPIRHAAQPFLRPAWESRQDAAIKVMIDRGRAELPKLLAGEG